LPMQQDGKPLSIVEAVRRAAPFGSHSLADTTIWLAHGEPLDNSEAGSVSPRLLITPRLIA